PDRQRIRVADAVARHFWRWLSDATDRGGRAGRVHRSSWASRRSSSYAGSDGHWHAVDRKRARLRDAWHRGPACRGRRTPDSGTVSRRRTWRRLRVPLGDRNARRERLLRELAVRKPAGRGDLYSPSGYCFELNAYGRSD